MGNETTQRYSGVVKMNPLGPHFYIDSDCPRDAHPAEGVDTVTDYMNNTLTELNEQHGWPIDFEHIEAHTPITRVSWNDDPQNREWEFGDVEVSLDWYSRQPLREWDDELHEFHPIDQNA